jgi:hypothetical protein
MIGRIFRLIIILGVFTLLICPYQEPAQVFREAKFSTRQTIPVVTIRQHQIELNGSPFTIKGVGYSPTPIGSDPEFANPYGDNYSAGASALYKRDLPMLRAMGANTVRLWGWNNSTDHTDFLDDAYNQGSRPIYVIAAYWINGNQNLSDPAVRNNLINGFRQMVAAHKNHPAILMWMIGNELNAPWMFGNSDALFTLINEMAGAAHEEEGASYHPVTTPLADVSLIETIKQRDPVVPNLDVWSVQLYRGDSFYTFFDDYAKVSSKPLVISEFGIDAYDDRNHAEYEKIGTPYQAVYAASLWKEIVAHSAICSGGSIMTYSDEWWKGKNGQNDSSHPNCPENDPAAHSSCGYAASSHPDGYANEEWWGIMRPVKNGSNPDQMQPRAVYRTLQSLWTNMLFLPLTRK